MFIIVVAFILVWQRVIAAENLFQVETVTHQNDTITPAQVADTSQYDIPAGATVILRCNIDGGTPILRYSTIEMAKVIFYEKNDWGLYVSALNSNSNKKIRKRSFCFKRLVNTQSDSNAKKFNCVAKEKQSRKHMPTDFF